MIEPDEPLAPERSPGGALVLVAVESALTRTLLGSGLRRSGFATVLVATAEEARSALRAHGRGGVLLVDGVRLVEEGGAWRGLAEEEPPLSLVALRVASRSSFAAAWVAELGCAALDEPLDLERVVEVVRRVAPGPAAAEGRRGEGPGRR